MTGAQMNDRKQPWPLITRLGFRFFFVYWLLYCLPWPGRVSLFKVVPGWEHASQAWRSIVPWVGIHLLHLDAVLVTYRATGSGDSTFAYVQNFCFVLLAATVAVTWSLLDRKRDDYRTLHAGLRILLRYTLALTLLSYGVEKLFPFQFQYPSLSRMIEPYGEFSPMGVLWSFMGSSPAYTRLSGFAEMIGGVLLLIPRTATLGAMLSTAVMLNVAALNFCYDAPVKLYSANLVAIGLFLLAPEMGTLVRFFVTNKPTESRKRLRIAVFSLKVAVIGVVFVPKLLDGYRAYQKMVVHPSRPPLYGLYEVESFATNGKMEPWKNIVSEYPGTIQVRTIGEKVRSFPVRYEAEQKIVSPEAFGLTLAYSLPDANHVRFVGRFEKDTVDIITRRKDLSEFLLANRGFHWISESPVNR